MQEVEFTGQIPICPNCKKPTKRNGSSFGFRTLMYFPPVYDENGNNTNPDRNIETTKYHCLECDKSYSISGNQYDGYKYNI
jgi:hypothetical protein